MATAQAGRAAVPGAEARIDHVRRFNRFYTRIIGVLQDGYLHSPFSLAQVRVLYELAHREGATASELARELDLDAGYLSRILGGFDRRGLLARTRSARDGRESVLGLTRAGQDALTPLEAHAREEIGALLARLPDRQQVELVAAMHTIEGLLGERTERAAGHAEAAAYILRPHRPGDMGWVVQRHGVLYAREYGFDEQFEALVATIVAKFVAHFDPVHERCWIAERDGERVGCIFLVRATRTIAKLRLFLVEPEARGTGLGNALVDDCLRFARSAGYRKVRLWTQSNLLAARHLYLKAGFSRIAEQPHHSYSQDLVAETWELRL
ncbi:MAG TPA: helix-turn-helix domain-containing GNAT family N-acetyltransferase [Chloroflexota bacterium]|nr:helix-turn-helix domain-containing GNAT family N-acetyltransferase [Chloroflexota bacterium]